MTGRGPKVDREDDKVTLRHETIRSLDMPGMTMVFKMFDLPTRHLTLSRLTKSKTAPRRRRLSSHACV
ncbi:MAG: copper-binding protein [Betaproteobacteria bacterium]